MALIDETYMRETFKFHKDVKVARITPYIAVASRRLQKWVGTAVYNSSDSDLRELLKLPEGLLAMHYMALNLNTSIRPDGLVKTEKVEGETTVQYLSPGETAQTAQQYLDQADEIIREFLQFDSLPAAPMSTGETGGQCEAATRWLT